MKRRLLLTILSLLGSGVALAEVELAKVAHNRILDRLAGEWVTDLSISKRVGEPNKAVRSSKTTIVLDPQLTAKWPANWRNDLLLKLTPEMRSTKNHSLTVIGSGRMIQPKRAQKFLIATGHGATWRPHRGAQHRRGGLQDLARPCVTQGGRFTVPAHSADGKAGDDGVEAQAGAKRGRRAPITGGLKTGRVSTDS